MKKRLLSAALALAMVLTMLPLTAFAVPALEDGVAVTYYDKDKVAVDPAGNLNGAAGWYWPTDSKVDGKNTVVYNAVAGRGGVIACGSATATTGTYYGTVAAALAKNPGCLKMNAANLTVDLGAVKTGTLIIDAMGVNVSVNGTLEQNKTAAEGANTVLTTLTLVNTAEDASTVSFGTSIVNQSFTLNATDVTVTGDVQLSFTKDVQGNLTVNPTRSTLANIKLDNSGGVKSTKSNTLTVKSDTSTVDDIIAYNAKVSVTATTGKSTIKSITTQKDSLTAKATTLTGGAVDLAARTEVTGDVTICGGTNSTLKMNAMTTIKGSVKLYGGAVGDDGGTTTPPNWKTTVTVDGTSRISSKIMQLPGDANGHKIDIKGGSSVGSSIDLNVGGKSEVIIADSKIKEGDVSADAIRIAAGSVKITNSYMGNIVAGKDDETSAVTVEVGTSSGKDTSKVGNIVKKTASSGKKVASPVLRLYGNATVGTATDVTKYIFGGTMGFAADKNELQGSLKTGYQIMVKDENDNDTYTYTNSFQDLIDKYVAPGGDEESDPPFVASLVNDDLTDPKTVTFQWREPSSTAGEGEVEATVLTVLTVSKGGFIDLPTSVNKTTVTYWYNVSSLDDAGDVEDGEGRTTVEGRFYVGEDTVLVAQVSDKIDKLVTGVKAVDSNNTNAPITATLSGTTINLSGAVVTKGEGGNILLSFEVNGAYKQTESGEDEQSVVVGWDSKTGKIQLEYTGTSKNVVLPTLRSNEVKVYDTIYTVTGSGLKEMVSHIQIGELDGSNVNADRSIVVPKASAGMSGSYVELGKDVKANLENKAKSYADFQAATDVIAALNALVAGLSQSTVDGYISDARASLARYHTTNKINGRNNWAASEFDNYDTVLLTPYLEIDVSNPTITGDASNTIMTLTISLKARYTVVDDSLVTDFAYTDIKNNVKTPWERTVSLSTAAVDDPANITDIHLTMPNTTLVYGDETVSYVHHAGRVYVAEWDDSKSTKISNNNGFANTSFVINNTAPLAIVRGTGDTLSGDQQLDELSVGTLYDNLQNAVDAVKNQGTITVLENYSGGINVSGAARTFTIQPKDTRTTVTITSVNGANTTAKFDDSSNTYTIQVSGSGTATVTSGNVTITVSTVNNGYARANLSTAAAGSVVTITPTPNSGFVSSTPTVTTNNGTRVAVTANDNGTYSFVVPSGATSITVTPAFVQSSSGSRLPFTDVSTTAWYYDGVLYCYTNYGASGVPLMQGLGATNFGVSSKMSRADLIEVLWRIAGSPIETSRSYFTDVQSSAWYYNSVTWAANHGYVNGYGDGTFQPNRYISRQELAQILWKYSNSPIVNVNLAASYADGQGVASWAQSAMQWAAGRSILSGRNSVNLTKLDAYETAYRTELAVTIMKYHRAYVA